MTKEEEAVRNYCIRVHDVAPCMHEEADTRIFVHVRHATEEDSKVITVKASDRDVLVIAVSVLPILQKIGLLQLWIAFGHGRNLRWIKVHDLYLSIAPQKSRGLLFFHAFTGCDVVSIFRGKGKKTAWQTCDVCDEASDIFIKLSQYPAKFDLTDLTILERFVVVMHDR